MLAAFGFENLGVVVGDMFFVDPTPNEGQETPERGVRLELRLVDRAEPQGSIYAGVPISFTRPVWRVDLFGSTESPPGTLDRAHHHPRFNGWEPGRRNFVPELSADPVSWLAGELADPDAVLTRAGVDPTRSAKPTRPASPRRPRTSSPRCGDCSTASRAASWLRSRPNPSPPPVPAGSEPAPDGITDSAAGVGISRHDNFSAPSAAA